MKYILHLKTWANPSSVDCCFCEIWYLFAVCQIMQLLNSSTIVNYVIPWFWNADLSFHVHVDSFKYRIVHHMGGSHSFSPLCLFVSLVPDVACAFGKLHTLTHCWLVGPLIKYPQFLEILYTSNVHPLIVFLVIVWLYRWYSWTHYCRKCLWSLAVPNWVAFLEIRPFGKRNNAEFTNLSSFTSPLMCSTHFAVTCRYYLPSSPATVLSSFCLLKSL